MLNLKDDKNDEKSETIFSNLIMKSSTKLHVSISNIIEIRKNP